MKKYLYCLNIVLMAFFSCQKDDDPLTPVLAGVYVDAMSYNELNPALQIAFIHDPILNIEQGEDSLDINQDGSHDIIISQRNLLGNSPANANLTIRILFAS